MRNTPGPSAQRHARRLVPQVQRPRLRPVWRKAIAASAVVAWLALTDWGARALGVALADRQWEEHREEFMADVERLVAEQRAKQMRAELAAEQERLRTAPTYFDPWACELHYGVDVPFCDEWMFRHLGEERAAKARAAEEARRAAKIRPSARPDQGPGTPARSPLRH